MGEQDNDDERARALRHYHTLNCVLQFLTDAPLLGDNHSWYDRSLRSHPMRVIDGLNLV